jgi:hypothetical protein
MFNLLQFLFSTEMKQTLASKTSRDKFQRGAFQRSNVNVSVIEGLEVVLVVQPKFFICFCKSFACLFNMLFVTGVWPKRIRITTALTSILEEGAYCFEVIPTVCGGCYDVKRVLILSILWGGLGLGFEVSGADNSYSRKAVAARSVT